MQIAKAIHAVARMASQDAIEAVEALGIKEPLHLAHFIGQLAHESGFKPQSENLKYSAARLMAVWPSRFPSRARADQFAHNPVKLANEVYNGRMGNRKNTDDGWNFRGRGFIQLTGRRNYSDCAKAIGVDLIKNPDLLLDPKTSSKAAHWFFTRNKIWPHCLRDDVKEVTRIINGGTHGIGDRRSKTRIALAILRGGEAPLKTVRLGSRSNDARLLQTALNQLGFGPIAADGVFGRKSDAALRKFQERYGLAVDGVCGTRTWNIIATKGP